MDDDILGRIKDKIDNPPEKRDHQKVSHSLARFIKAKEAAAANANVKIKRIKKHAPKTAAIDNEDKPGIAMHSTPSKDENPNKYYV